ncbi:MAG TPA: glycerophosphodiester phosphodiesterase family protein [bacterium]|nr:glycerophosphodiester phosphodiesterase family protein [bacterium]
MSRSTARGQRIWGSDASLGTAHRGAPRHAPENTLASFRVALDDGARSIECDVQRTKDGHLMVIHDQTVDRTTDGHGRVGAFALDELRRLDAGRWFDPAFAGERVPLLDEAMALIRGRATLRVEIKNAPMIYDGIEQQVLEAIHRHGMDEEVLVTSFDHESVRRIRMLSSQTPTGIIFTGRLIDAAAAARAAGADAVCMNWAYVTADIVARAHAAGLRVFAWPVDDEDRFRHCRAAGVDGMTSNEYRLLARWLREA